MARGKTMMARIQNEKVLKSTFQKRKKGLIKKVKELTTLCDIIACVVIYGPVIGGRPPEIFTWPEEQDRVLAAIRMYKEKEEHSKRTSDLCNYLEDRRRLTLGMSNARQVNMALPCGGYGRPGMSSEVAMEYLKWVEARIKTVEERINLVKNASGLLYGNDQCQDVMFGDKMMLIPVSQVDDVRNFGYGFWQNWHYQKNPFGDIAQFDVDAYDHTPCGRSSYNHPVNMDLLPGSIQFQQSFGPNAITCYQQKQNQKCLCDPYLMGMEQSNTMPNWSQHCHPQQQQNCENMPYLSNVAQDQPWMFGRMDDMVQLCPYADDWSSPDAASSNYSTTSSNLFNKAVLEDPLEYFLITTEFGDAAGENIPSQNAI